MEHLKRNATKFEVYDTAQAVARQQGISIDGRDELQQVVDHMQQSLEKETANPAMRYGRLTEAMFEYVVAGLGHVRIIKQEDAGSIISHDSSLNPPDYRLVTSEGIEYLVEVKSVRKEKPDSPFVLTERYYESLKQYAAMFDSPLKFALYWSHWNIWALIDADRLPVRNGKRSVTMIEAVKMSEMSTLGDLTIGTKVPLTLRLVANPKKPSSLSSTGEASFTVGQTEVLCAGTRVLGTDCDLAWYIMQYGKWSDLQEIPYIVGGQIVSIEIAVSPETWQPEQGFAIIGDLSGMISSQFKQHTGQEGKSGLTRPFAEPNQFGITIPDIYKGGSLPLWRFVMQPNYD